LVVDDDVIVLRLLKINLQSNGYNVITATNGKEALEIVNSEYDIDLILLDIMMPEMNGFQVCTIIREKYSIYELPIMFVSAKFQINDIIEGFDMGGNDYVLKPYDFKELHARTKTLVRLRTLTKANEALKRVRELTTKFHAMTIHDLKNPLTTIFLRSDIVENQLPKDSQLIEHLISIKKMSKLMLSLITDFEEMSKIESGYLSIIKNRVCLNKLTLKIIDDNYPNAKKKEQEIRFKSCPIDNVNVFADESMLARVIDNLLSNAIKYSPANSPIDIIIEKIVNLNDKVTIKFIVKDYGQGLSKEDLKYVFHKFHKLSAKPTAGESSSGLGLSIAKELIELNNGRIWVESKQNIGSSFIFELPEFNY
jgi:signal transduction histidine kinase